MLFSTERARQIGRHVPDEFFKFIFLNENVGISIEISLIFFPQGPINNNSALVEIMPIRRRAIIWANDGPAYWRLYASLGLNELIVQSPQPYLLIFAWRN